MPCMCVLCTKNNMCIIHMYIVEYQQKPDSEVAMHNTYFTSSVLYKYITRVDQGLNNDIESCSRMKLTSDPTDLLKNSSATCV